MFVPRPRRHAAPLCARRPPTAALAVVALLSIAAVAAVTLDAIAPGAGPLIQPLSAHAHTDFAALWYLSVGAASVSVLLLAYVLQPRSTSSSMTSSSFPGVRVLLVAAGCGLAAVSVFASDPWFPWERPPTMRGAMHVAAVLTIVAAFAAAIGRRWLQRHTDGRGEAAAAERVCTVMYLASLTGALVYLAATVSIGRPPLLVGLWERLLLGSALLWCGLLAGTMRGGTANDAQGGGACGNERETRLPDQGMPPGR